MASRNLFHLSGCVLNKCFFTNLQCFKQSFHPTTIYRGHQGFSNFVRSFRSVKHIQVVESKPPVNRDSKILWKNLYFTVAFSGAVLVGAIIWEYENMSKMYRRATMYRQFTIQRSGWRGTFQKYWNELSEADKLFAAILLANLSVFIAWRIPALKSTMLRYFTLSVNSHSSWSLVFSMFSHYSFLHLAINMCVLYSFSGHVTSQIGKEQFLALYLTSGIVSGFFSQCYRFVIRSAGASVGASGAIAGVIGFLCFEFPQASLTPIFFPFILIPAKTAFFILTSIETMGCLMRWKIFDHAAHLSGLVFGWAWHSFIRKDIWLKREVVTDVWHKVRSRKPPT